MAGLGDGDASTGGASKRQRMDDIFDLQEFGTTRTFGIGS